MKQYKEIFEKAIKGASSKVKCIDEKLGLWAVPHKERNILFYGYDFGLNRSSVETVCKDKYLTWILLNENKKINKYNSPLEMKFFNAYNRKKLTFREPLSKNLYKSIDEKKTLVLSFTDKWGEKDIYKVSTKPQVDNALQELGLKNYFLSTNFVPVSQEYRVILGRFENNIEFLLCLQKEPLKIKGDGKKTINRLVLEKLVDLQEGVELEEVWKDINTQLSLFKLKLSDILSIGKEINITWRLNQNIGSKVALIDEDNVPKDILDIAKEAFQTLNMSFGCIDIAKCEESNENKYLIIGSKTQVLTDLLEYCRHEDLVEVTKKVIKERVNSYEIEKFDDVKISEENNLEEDIDISTYKGRSKVRKECIKKVSEKLQFNIKFYSQDYLAVINDNIFMIEFDMGINNSSSVFACGDKGVTPKILRLSEIPCVTHEIFSLDEDNENGVMEKIIEKFNEWNKNVVLKVRRGGQGIGLYHIKNEVDLERALLKEIKNGIVLSPYLNIINEYRVLVLNGNVLCVYKKNRLHVRGDGRSSLSQLVTSQIKDSELRNNIMEDLVSEGINLNQIVSDNEKYLVSWKHNLSYGATPEISRDHEINKKLSDIARSSAQAIGAKFVAVDVVDTIENNLCVLEVNSFPGFYHFVKIYGKDNLNILLEKLLSETAKIPQIKQSGKLLTEVFEEKMEVTLPFPQEKR